MTTDSHSCPSVSGPPADAPYPPLPSDRPTKAEPHVSYGEWEPDPDQPPVYRKHVHSPREARDWMLFGGIAEMHPAPGGYRRKRFETWWENGQRMGRWEWERRGPS